MTLLVEAVETEEPVIASRACIGCVGGLIMLCCAEVGASAASPLEGCIGDSAAVIAGCIAQDI